MAETTANEKTSMTEKKANPNFFPSGEGLPAAGPSLRGLTVKEGGSKRNLTFTKHVSTNDLNWTFLFLHQDYGFPLKENSGTFGYLTVTRKLMVPARVFTQ